MFRLRAFTTQLRKSLMRSPIFRQSTLDRSRSVMGLWILTLTLTLGVVAGERFCLRDDSSTQADHVVSGRRLPSIPRHLATTVFVPQSPTIWLASLSTRSEECSSLTGLRQANPFEQTHEPDFCKLNPNRLRAGLSIKLARQYPPTSIKPVLFLNLVAESPLEHFWDTPTNRKEPNFHGAFISGAAFVR